ncbi:MAG TPA: winged helix-turn-helix domain-containing protein [Pyrinomonadaceae bacterium]|nr:winged helix-turn-helix domain-containing protein [Acidobacteriota bacterium]HQZ96611.1 winged helix-turn-helix domain-containing protein [Pyrinomonadaceae bacterium]
MGTDAEIRSIYRFGTFELDVEERRLIKGEQVVALTPKAFDVLVILVERAGHLVEKEELMGLVWPDSFVEEANVTRIVHTLRKVLGVDENGSKFIETVAKKGYRFVTPVSTLGKNPELTAGRDADTSRGYELQTSDLQVAAEVDMPGRTGKPLLSRRRLALVCLFAISAISIVSWRAYKSTQTPGEPFPEIKLSRLTNSGNVGKVALSPDGNLIAFESVGKEGVSLSVRQIDIGNSIELVGPQKGLFSFFIFSPDGKIVYYGYFPGDKVDAEVFAVPALGGLSQKLALSSFSMSFGPDKRQFAHVVSDSGSSRTILLIDSLDGGERRELISRRRPAGLQVMGQPCSWSPSGRTIAVIHSFREGDESYSNIIGVDPTNGSEKALTAKRWRSLNSVQWLRDESGLLVTGSDTAQSPSQVWFISAADGEVRRLTNDLNEYSFIGVTPDGKQFVSVQESRTSSLWLGTLGQGALTTRNLISETGELDTIAAASSGAVTFRSNANGGSNLSVIESSGARRQITVDGQVDERGLCLTPDGKYVVFPSRRSGKVNLWRSRPDGSEMLQLTNGDGEFYPNCSADNRSVVFQKGFGFGIKSTLWKISLDGGGEEMQLTNYFAMRPTVSFDGRTVAFFYMDDDKWRVGTVSIDGGPMGPSVNVPDGITDRVARWSTDGKSLMLVDNDGDIGNIWRVPLDGGTATQITNFEWHKIEDFALFPGSTQVVLSRSTAVSDVVLASGR